MIEIYGSPQSSSGRCFWCLEEIGLEYNAKKINFREKEHQSPEYLKINPNGKVPSLRDGDFVIWESMAINFYLAEKYKKELLGNTSIEKGLVHQWSFWSIAELQPPMIDAFIQLNFVPEPRRNQEVIDKALSKLPALFTVLENELSKGNYLVGENFSLADINVFTAAIICEAINFELSEYPKTSEWFNKLKERASYKNYQALIEKR